MCVDGAAEPGAPAAGMRVFVVRHEKRPPEDATFLVSLTDAGAADAASSLLPQLQEAGITKVITSPFLRVLQTVAPYLASAGLKAGPGTVTPSPSAPGAAPPCRMCASCHSCGPLHSSV
jgi:hypothetical protein